MSLSLWCELINTLEEGCGGEGWRCFLWVVVLINEGYFVVLVAGGSVICS